MVGKYKCFPDDMCLVESEQTKYSGIIYTKIMIILEYEAEEVV